MYLLTKISSAHLSYYMLCFSSLKCPSNDMVPPLCRIIAPTKREKKMWPNFLQFYLGFFFLGRNVFQGSSIRYFFITSKCRDCLIPPLQRYHYKSTPDGQLTYLHVEQALGLGTKNMLNFLINLFTSRNGFLSMSFKSTSSSIFLHPKYYLHVVLRTFFIRLSKCALYPKQILLFTISLWNNVIMFLGDLSNQQVQKITPLIFIMLNNYLQL